MSSSPLEVKAVFDVGKTNKKFVLFDEDYNISYRKQETFDLIEDDDGDPCEDLTRLTEWIKHELSEVLENPKFTITDLNFSTYGASLVHIDAEGKTITPLYDYMKPVPEAITQSFYESYGGKEHLSLETASPPMGLLNSGFQLYWLKKVKPDVFGKIRNSLHFPQYLSYLFTGKKVSELTSIGCHTAMWDFDKAIYHRWLEQENVHHLLPEIYPVSHTEKTVFAGNNFRVGPGIHDSSAALAPYLKTLDDPFLLLSTGTWNITFNPFNKDRLTFDELQQDCLCYLNIYGDQVKASRVFLGGEYRYQKNKLVDYFEVQNPDEEIEPDGLLLKKLARHPDPEKKLKLEKAHRSGPYPSEKTEKWDAGVFSSYKEAYHQLMLDLVVIQERSILLSEGSDKIKNVIVTGGFGRNRFFLKLLASRLPQKKIYSAEMPHATALGAAITMHKEKDKRSLNLQNLLGLELHQEIEHTGIENYTWQP